MSIILPKVKNVKKKKHLEISYWRENKIGVHTTIKGKGKIARLRRK
jgi:hypothetical protein